MLWIPHPSQNIHQPSSRFFFRSFPLLLVAFSLFGVSGCANLPLIGHTADPLSTEKLATLAPEAEKIPSVTAEDVRDLEAPSQNERPTSGTSSFLANGESPTVENLEELFRQALAMAAEDRVSLAGDDLTALLHEIRTPSSIPDSCTDQQLRSLERRSILLKALLVEQTAFAENTCEADPILASGYLHLAGQFPDSLVPATGEPLPGIMADLLKWDNPRVEKWVDYFTGRGRTTYALWLRHKAEVGDLVTNILTQGGLPPQLIYLAMIESGISPHAVSSVQAVGPWQFMAPTAKARGLHINWWVDERKDLEFSTHAAVAYLQSLHATFGDWSLVLAAYNSGENRVLRKIRQRANDNYWELNLPAQTADFVPKFIAAARIGENPERYGFTPPEVTPVSYETITVNQPTSLDLIAKCAHVTDDVVSRLNPGLLRGSTPPNMGAYPVRVPVGSAGKTTKALAKIPADKRLTWTRHNVVRGETLSCIASNYGSAVSDIARVNHMKNIRLIRPGQQLLIPMPAELDKIARNRAAEKGHYVPPAGYKRVSYKVKAGDTLGRIARKLGVTLRHLRKVNNIHRSSLIHPGDRLYAYRPAGK